MSFVHADHPLDPHIQRFARSATAPEAGLQLMGYQATISLVHAASAVFDCLRNLRCLCDWWPGASRLQPLPPGLCGVGDCGILHVDGDDALLKVLAFKPGSRLILTLALARAPLLLDLTVTTLQAASRVRLKLEIPTPLNPLRQQSDALWLRLKGDRAAAALAAHLRQSPRVRG